MMQALRALMAELEQDPLLDQPTRLRERIRAMDHLEDLLVHAPTTEAMDGADTALYHRARSLHLKLEARHRELCQSIRRSIMRGEGAEALRPWSSRDECASGQRVDGYDHLDALMGDVLSFDEPIAEIARLDADMVFYQPTPARHIFDLIDRAAIDDSDVLIDLGSGLGHVPMLVSICTGARCIGIERETVYVEGARRTARELKLEHVAFLAQDARDADLSCGTVFYLYTPFTGDILRSVLDMLHREATKRDIRVAALGPCTTTVAQEAWLTVVGSQETDRITLFRPVCD